MRYIICPNIDSKRFVEIDELEYEEIRKASIGLPISLQMEFNIDSVLENFLELEEDLLKLSLRRAISNSVSYEWTQEAMRTANRRLSNLLGSCRFYLDYARHELKKISPKTQKSFKENCSIEYDTFLGYRFMEALRNYSQHRGNPIEILVHNTDRRQNTDKKVFLTIDLYAVNERLREGDFKQEVMEELEQLGEMHDVRAFVRQYISSLGKVHESFRHSIGENLNRWEQTVIENKGRLEKEVGLKDYESYLKAVVIDEEKYSGYLYIDSRILETRRNLEQKNGVLSLLSNRYVTNEVLNQR